MMASAVAGMRWTSLCSGPQAPGGSGLGQCRSGAASRPPAKGGRNAGRTNAEHLPWRQGAHGTQLRPSMQRGTCGPARRLMCGMLAVAGCQPGGCCSEAAVPHLLHWPGDDPRRWVVRLPYQAHRGYESAQRTASVTVHVRLCRWERTPMPRCSGTRLNRRACAWTTCALLRAPAARLSSSCSPQVSLRQHFRSCQGIRWVWACDEFACLWQARTASSSWAAPTLRRGTLTMPPSRCGCH